MTYDTTITSKGTITIAAPLRRELGLKTGQKVTLKLNRQRQLLLETGTDMGSFGALRARITSTIPSHLKGLSGEALHKAAAAAWVSGHHD